MNVELLCGTMVPAVTAESSARESDGGSGQVEGDRAAAEASEHGASIGSYAIGSGIAVVAKCSAEIFVGRNGEVPAPSKVTKPRSPIRRGLPFALPTP